MNPDMHFTILVVVLTIVKIVHSQGSSPSPLCNSSITDANAFGTVGFEAVGAGNPTWAVTFKESGGSTQTDLWFDSAGKDYGDDLALGFDACALIIRRLPLNTLQLGQEADEGCGDMLTPECVDTLRQRAADTAFGLTQTFTPGQDSNLTANALPNICRSIAEGLGDDTLPFPKECYKELVEQNGEKGYVGATVDPYGEYMVPRVIIGG